jgi:hypothetical protein
VLWPLNFKTSRIENYDGSTNPAEWLEFYQLAIEAAGGDSYVMTHYLPVCLSSFTMTWILGLSWGQFVPGITYVGCSLATSMPCAYV